MNSTEQTIERLTKQGHLIGDEWTASDAGGHYSHHDPNTGRLQAEVALGGAAEITRAVDAATAAGPAWRAMPLEERAAILFRLADLLVANDPESALLNARDNGTPISTMRPGLYAASWVRYYAGWVDKVEGHVVPVSNGLDYVLPEPFGVIGAIVPWNGPMMGMGQKVAPALAAGNAVVAKPPEIAPFGALRFAELALEAGLPPGVLNVVTGGAEAGQALVRDRRVGKVSFTGGHVTARAVMITAAETLKPLALELGGKSANIVFPDADLDTAAMLAVLFGVGVLSGQGCALPTRLYVHDDVYDDVVERLIAQTAAMAVGDPSDPASFMGPVVTEVSCKRILGVIARAESEGSGRLLTGGTRMGGSLTDGYYVAPTIFGDVVHGSDLATNEVFGPVLSVLRFTDEDEVVAKANDSAFGLGAYLHTTDISRAHRVAGKLEAGMVIINGLPGMSPGAPFGGYKQSGFGREGGRWGIEEFLQQKNVFIAGTS